MLPIEKDIQAAQSGKQVGYSTLSPGQSLQQSPAWVGAGASNLPGGSDYSNYQSQLKAAQDAYNSAIAAMYRPQPQASYYNTASAYSQAQQQAHGTVDPLYNKYINELNTQMDAQRQTAQQQNQLDTAGIQQVLANTLQQNQITGQRVGEDTGTALSNLSNAQQNYKQTEGLSFDQAQRALQGNLGASNTSESGLGQQQSELAATKEYLGQQAQGQQYQTQRQAEQLFMNRSIEDLGRGGEVAKGQAGLQTQQSSLNLNKTMQSIADQQDQRLTSLQQQQQAALAAQSNAYYDQNLSNWQNSLYGKISPENYSATLQAYQMR